MTVQAPTQPLPVTIPRSLAELLSEDVPKFRQLPCRTFISVGTCPYRERCVYLHDPRLMSKDARTKTRKKNKEDIVQDSLFWPVLPCHEVNHRLDNDRQPHVIQRYGVPCPQDNQYRRHDQAVYSMWMNFVTFCNLENNTSTCSIESDAELAMYAHPSYTHPVRGSTRRPQPGGTGGAYMDKQLSINPFTNVDRLDVFKTLSLGATLRPDGTNREAKVVSPFASKISPPQATRTSPTRQRSLSPCCKQPQLALPCKANLSPVLSPRSCTQCSFSPPPNRTSPTPNKEEYNYDRAGPRLTQATERSTTNEDMRRKALRMHEVKVANHPYYNDRRSLSPTRRLSPPRERTQTFHPFPHMDEKHTDTIHPAGIPRPHTHNGIYRSASTGPQYKGMERNQLPSLDSITDELSVFYTDNRPLPGRASSVYFYDDQSEVQTGLVNQGIPTPRYGSSHGSSLPQGGRPSAAQDFSLPPQDLRSASLVDDTYRFLRHTDERGGDKGYYIGSLSPSVSDSAFGTIYQEPLLRGLSSNVTKRSFDSDMASPTTVCDLSTLSPVHAVCPSVCPNAAGRVKGPMPGQFPVQCLESTCGLGLRSSAQEVALPWVDALKQNRLLVGDSYPFFGTPTY